MLLLPEDSWAEECWELARNMEVKGRNVQCCQIATNNYETNYKTKGWRNKHELLTGVIWVTTQETHFLPFMSLQDLILNKFFWPYITFVTKKRHLFHFYKKWGQMYRNPCEWTLVFIFPSVSSLTLSTSSILWSFASNNSKNYLHLIITPVLWLHWKMTILFITGHKSPWSVSLERSPQNGRKMTLVLP